MSDYQIIKLMDDGGSEGFTLKGNWEPEIMNILMEASVDELRLSGIEWPDFTVLAPIAKKVKRLLITAATAKSTGLENFSEIKYFLLDEPISPAFDLSCFKRLEKAVLCWDKKYPDSFFSLPYLTKLKLRHFDEGNCEKIGESSSIKDLSILESKISSLEGLQDLQSLKSLTIAYIRNLENISSLSELSSLESLHIESCPKISSLSPIKNIKGLKKLHIEKVKARFDDLDWVADMPDLNYVLNEAEVDNINWSAVFKNDSIKEFATRTHDGYEVTDDELISMASQAGRVVKVIERYPPKKKPMIAVEF